MKNFISMKKYETIFIVKPDLSEADVEKLSEEFKEVVSSNEAEVRVVEMWGKRKLAYPIKKQRDGYYILFYTEGLPAAIAELERKLRIDDRVIKFMTVRIKDHLQWTPSPLALQKKQVRTRVHAEKKPGGDGEKKDAENQNESKTQHKE